MKNAEIQITPLSCPKCGAPLPEQIQPDIYVCVHCACRSVVTINSHGKSFAKILDSDTINYVKEQANLAYVTNELKNRSGDFMKETEPLFKSLRWDKGVNFEIEADIEDLENSETTTGQTKSGLIKVLGKAVARSSRKYHEQVSERQAFAENRFIKGFSSIWNLLSSHNLSTVNLEIYTTLFGKTRKEKENEIRYDYVVRPPIFNPNIFGSKSQFLNEIKVFSIFLNSKLPIIDLKLLRFPHTFIVRDYDAKFREYNHNQYSELLLYYYFVLKQNLEVFTYSSRVNIPIKSDFIKYIKVKTTPIKLNPTSI